jgi:hypothetical protein
MNNSLVLSQSFVLKKKLSLRKKFAWQGFSLAAILLITALSVFYIFQANLEAAEIYLVQKYRTELKQLSEENDNLAASSIQKNSLNRIAVLLEEAGQGPESEFKKVDKIHYIQILDNQLVVR